MNREIKYRQLIWDYGADEFLEWHYWGFINGKFIAPLIDGINPEDNYQSQMFTGLKDKNDKCIYDGDIVAVWSKPWKELAYIAKKFEVKWVEIDSKSGWNICYAQTLEVIGNVHSNSELLK